MKMLVSAAVAAASLSMPAVAQPQQERRPVVVTAPDVSSVPHWVDRVSRQISATIEVPAAIRPGDLSSGRAAVVFRCDGDGRPVAVTLARRSGYPTLDRIAMQTIRRLPSLSPMPPSFSPNQRFRANIVFAYTQGEYDGQMRALRREAAATQMAASSAPSDGVIALNASPLTQSTAH